MVNNTLLPRSLIRMLILCIQTSDTRPSMSLKALTRLLLPRRVLPFPHRLITLPCVITLTPCILSQLPETSPDNKNILTS